MKTIKQLKKQNRFVLWTKNLSAYTKNKFITSLIYIVMLFVVLGTNYVFIFGAFVPDFFVLDIFLMLVSIAPIFFFRKTYLFDVIWLPIIFAFVLFLAVLNVNYYKFFGITFSIKDLKNSIENLGQGAQRLWQLDWVSVAINIVLFVIFLSVLLVFNIRFRY